jgi:hypothetical protein
VTTFLNPTIWLLVAVVAASARAIVRGRPPRAALGDVIDTATRWPVIALLAAMALGGLGSRAVVGWLAPGAYAEDVVQARAFLSAHRFYRGDERAELGRWLRETPPAARAWTLPGVSECQASAFEHRQQFYTSQAHSPVLLLASTPVVAIAGGRGLYATLVVLSLAALGAAWLGLVRQGGVPPRSREAWLGAVALAGWQPVLAGLRQGDVVLIAASLVVCAWSLARRERWAAAGAVAGLAAVVAPAAAGGVLALARWPRAFGWACLTAGGAIAATLAVGGPMLLADFTDNAMTAARTYAGVMPNYALAGRLVGGGLLPAAWAGAAFVLLASLAWRRARTVDQAFGLFTLLGLLAAPIVWSQHVALALVPLAVLLAATTHPVGSAGLLAWAALATIVSLPDPAVALMSDAMWSTGWPLVPCALAALWVLLLVVFVPPTSRPTAEGR